MKYLLFYIQIFSLLFLYSCSNIYFDKSVFEKTDDVEVIVEKKDIKKLENKEDSLENIEEIKTTDKKEEANKSIIDKKEDIKEKEIINDKEVNDINVENRDFVENENFAEVVKIGLLIPLTGKNAFLGSSIYKSAEMALFESKANNVELLPIDSGNSIDTAVYAARSLEKKGVSIIIGPIFSSQAVAVRSAINKNIPLLSFTNDESIAADDLWVFGFSPRQEITAIFNEMKNHTVTSLSIIIPNSAYGKIALDNIVKESILLKIKIKNVYKYSISSDNFSDLGAEIEKAKQSELDALLILAGGKQLREISSRAQFRGISPKNTIYFGISSWNSDKILGEPSLLGGIFIAPEQSSFESFVSRYYKIYGAIPSEISGLSYDIFSLCSNGLKKSKNINQFISFLTKSSGFNGVFGFFSLDVNGQLKRKFVSYKVMKRSFVKK